MASDTDMASIHDSDVTPLDSPQAESSHARKVHWNLERGKSLQGAMKTRSLNREEDRQTADRHARKQKRRTEDQEFGHGRVKATNERDRMDEHEAREERLRRARRAERKKREERERLEREHEVAVDDAETSSLDEGVEWGTKKKCSGGKNAGMLNGLPKERS